MLFNFPQFALFDKENPVMAFPNPFYQIYEGAATASRAKIIHMDLTCKNNFQSKLTQEEMRECDLVIINYPNNPTSSTTTMDELVQWVNDALKYDFVLINDECYSELYFDEDKKPISLLEACEQAGNSEFKKLFSFKLYFKKK